MSDRILGPDEVGVRDQTGKFYALPKDQALAAFQSGAYAPADESDIREAQMQKKYGSTVGSMAAAAGLGAQRMATLGLGDQTLTTSEGLSPEELKELSQRNPLSTFTGETLGAVGTGLLSGGVADALEGAGLSSNVAKIAGKLTTPLGAADYVGSRIGAAAAPWLGKGASIFANPETSPVINKILAKIPEGAIGGSATGAAIGLGQSLSEDAMGDPDALGQKMMANVGYGALLGGGFDAIFGGIRGSIEGSVGKAAMAQQIKNDLARSGARVQGTAEAGQDFVAASGIGDLPPSQQEPLLDALSSPAKDIAERQQAATDLGVPLISPEMTSDSLTIQRIGDSLQENVSPTAIARQNMFRQAYNQVSDQVMSVLREGIAEPKTKVQAGEDAFNAIVKGMEEKRAPIDEIYNRIEQHTPNVALIDADRERLANGLMLIAKQANFAKGSPEHTLLMNYAEHALNQENADQLQSFLTAFRESSSRAGLRSIYGKVRNLVDDVREKAIIDKAPADAQAGLLTDIQKARDSWTSYREKMTELARPLVGKARLSGPEALFDKLDKMPREQLIDRLSRKENSKFLDFLSKEHPDVADIVRQQVKSDLTHEIMKGGKFNHTALFRWMNDAEPEFKDFVFTKDQQKVLNGAQKWIKSMPGKFNPSGTGARNNLENMFKSPYSYSVGWASDSAKLHFMKTFGADATRMASLVKADQMAAETSFNIHKGIKDIFKGIPNAFKAVQYASTMALSHEAQQKRMNDATDWATNPWAASETMEKSTAEAYPFLPKAVSAMHGSVSRAFNLLDSVSPKKNLMQGPLSRKYIPSRAEMAKFNRYASVVEDPVTTLAHVKSGTLTAEHMTALQTVYPQIYQEMASGLYNEIADRSSKKDGLDIPYATKMSMSLFLGHDLVDGLDPTSIGSNQQILDLETSVQDQRQGLQPTESGLSKLTKSERIKTPNQDIESDDDSDV